MSEIAYNLCSRHQLGKQGAEDDNLIRHFPNHSSVSQTKKGKCCQDWISDLTQVREKIKIFYYFGAVNLQLLLKGTK